MRYQQYGHVSFDLWLTLIKSNPAYKQKRNRLMMEFFSIEMNPQSVDEIYNKCDKVFNKINEITGGNLDAYELWLIFLGELNVDISKLSTHILQQFIDETEKLFFEYHPTLLDANTPKLFKQIVEEGITISLLCNTAFTKSVFLKKLLALLEIDKYFSFQLYSDEMGYSKPNIKVYQQLFDGVQKIKPITKEQIIHVGDNPIADFFGANNFGIKGGLLMPGETVCTFFGL